MIRVLEDALSFVIISGWIYLLLVGPEMDHALSGGIPGHQKNYQKEVHFKNTLSEIICWVLFLGIIILLPIIAYWSFKTFASGSFI